LLSARNLVEWDLSALEELHQANALDVRRREPRVVLGSDELERSQLL